MTATALMIQGATSDAGKTAFVAGLCRLLTRQGYSVAPFKPQNMALNSAVTKDGGEIGRAQALQARACGIAPMIDMNPVLLKPNSDTGSQVIVQGRVIANMDAKSYHSYKPNVLRSVLESYNRLSQHYDIIIIEGAGSPAEINLREHDIANMGFAEAIDCPVILIADIERGGVFAHLLGTLAVLSESEQNRIGGFIINRFRGDLDILQPGIDWLEQRCKKTVLGVLPYLKNLHLEAEDSLNIIKSNSADTNDALKIIVPQLPKISNHTDFDALRLHPQVELQFISESETIPAADLIIIPGSKSVRSDLQWLNNQGWNKKILKHLRYGGKIIGICGGFQMLGNEIRDPIGIEGEVGTSIGLELLDIITTLKKEKILQNKTGRLSINNAIISGYEIHCGITHGPALDYPAVHFSNSNDGALSQDGMILGTYLHGLFDTETAITALLEWAGIEDTVESNYQDKCEYGINQLADAIENHIDMKEILNILNLKKLPSQSKKSKIGLV